MTIFIKENLKFMATISMFEKTTFCWRYDESYLSRSQLKIGFFFLKNNKNKNSFSIVIIRRPFLYYVFCLLYSMCVVQNNLLDGFFRCVRARDVWLWRLYSVFGLFGILIFVCCVTASQESVNTKWYTQWLHFMCVRTDQLAELRNRCSLILIWEQEQEQ